MFKNENGFVELSIKEFKNLEKVLNSKGFKYYNSFESVGVVGYMFEKEYKEMPGIIETSRITIFTDGASLSSCEWYNMETRERSISNFYMHVVFIKELSKLEKKFKKVVA